MHACTYVILAFTFLNAICKADKFYKGLNTSIDQRHRD